MNSHLILGFPGFIATFLIQELFKKGVTSEVMAIVQYDQLAKAKAVVKKIEQQWQGCQIVLFEGDITLPDLNMAENDFQFVAPKITVVWHLAAEHHLMIKREKAWQVNVHGTANVNEFVCKLPSLKRYMYFSSAFVAGKREGTVLETELIRPEAFHNFLEESKFEAELLVDDLKRELPITIVRPTMICGHSQTGETHHFEGFYYLINLIDYLKDQMLFPQLGSKYTELNVVAVDYVVEVCIALFLNEEALGKTVHIADTEPYKVLAVYQRLVQLMTERKTFSTLPLGIAKVMLEQEGFRQSWRVPPQMIDYLDNPICFETTCCQHLLKESDIKLPDLFEILPVLVEFYNENKHLKSYFVKI